jgi:bifunctional UDP-N-acetylglucosamine pyrophosphorylase/glucosamine-1-phosphate N-acetyltransferase
MNHLRVQFTRALLIAFCLFPTADAQQTENVQAVVLAAGRGTRFKSNKSKMLETICGQEMVLFVVKLLEALAIETTVVVGYEKEHVMATIEQIKPQHVRFAEQQSYVAGTGDAVRCSSHHWHQDHILILNGDMPLVTRDIIEDLYKEHRATDAAISFVVAHHVEPSGYGRIVEKDGHIKIVEKKDFTGNMHDHPYINAGIYIVKRSFLEEYIHKLDTNNASREFYVTDLVELADLNHFKVTTSIAPFDAIRGVNDQHERWTAEQIVRNQLLHHWMKEGVHFADAHNVILDLDVTIGAGSYIGCGTQLVRGTSIGKNCTIDAHVILEQCTIDDNAQVHAMSILKGVHLDADASVGPFAHMDGDAGEI